MRGEQSPAPVEEPSSTISKDVGVHKEQDSGVHYETLVGEQITEALGAHLLPPVGEQYSEDVRAHSLPPVAAHTKSQVGVHLEPPAGAHTTSTVGALALADAGAQQQDLGVDTPTKIKPERVITPTRGKSVRTQKKEAGVQKTDRHSADKKKVNFYMNREKLREMNVFATRCDLTLTDFFEMAGAHFMECVGVHKLKDVGGNAPHDDLKIYRTSDNIVMMYKQYTGGRWKPHCDYAAEQFNSADIRYVEIGILNTLLKFKGKKINSFRYFVPEIEEALAVKLGDETLDIMLKRRREQWEVRKRAGE